MVITLCILGVGAVGVILLGWFWYRLVAVITSIAALLGNKGKHADKSDYVDILSPLRINKLNALCKDLDRKLGDC